MVQKLIDLFRSNFTEGKFLDTILTNCAWGVIKKKKGILNDSDVGDIVGRACEKIIVSGAYNLTDTRAAKISYLQKAVSGAAHDIIRQNISIQTQKKVVTARHKQRQSRGKVFTIEDVLAEANYVISPSARKRKSA